MVGFAQIIQVFGKVVQDCTNVRLHAHFFIGFSWGSKSLSPPPTLLYLDHVECGTSPTNESTLYAFIEWLSIFEATQLFYVVLRSEIQIVDIEDEYTQCLFCRLLECPAQNTEVRPPSPHLRMLGFMISAECSGVFHRDIVSFIYITLNAPHFCMNDNSLMRRQNSGEVDLCVGTVFRWVNFDNSWG